MSRLRQPESPVIELVTDPGGETTLYIDDRQAMQAWEEALMHRSAEILCRHGSEFLEVGLGLGLSSLRIASNPATRTHTVVEKYQQVIDLFASTHPSVPDSLRIVCADFLDYIESAAPSSVDGIFFDPYLPAETRNSQEFWDEVMPVLSRLLRPDGVFIPYFATRPALYWMDYFERVEVERCPFATYQSTEYTLATSGYAYIQCYSRPTPVQR